jgi:hypothetical protein
MSQVKLQVPMDKKVRDGLEKRAKDLGFDSAQAYIRFWAKAEADGRQFYIGEPEEVTPELEKILEQAEKEIANGETYGPFEDVDEAIKFLKTNSAKSLGFENED